MPKTHVTIQEESFLINGQLSYTEIVDSNPAAHGLLMNARFIQGIFDDKAEPSRFARFGKGHFDPLENTHNLIKALPQWYAHGLRAFTVGFQGGGPCFTINNATIENNPFGDDGTELDPAYAERMDALIKAADALGMVVIVSYLYSGQEQRLRDGKAIRNAVRTASNFLKDGGYTNVLVEVANEHNAFNKNVHPMLKSVEGAAALIDLARQESGGLLVGCSALGGYAFREVGEASDFILIHGNKCSRQQYYNLIQEVKSWDLQKPIICNEDSQAVGKIDVSVKAGVSWGYYNNWTTQEPPTDWSITAGEDHFFARRLAEVIGISLPLLPEEECYYLQGLEPHATYEGKRWIRLAGLYPETIDYVDFFRNGELLYTAYEEAFSLYHISNWRQGPYVVQPDDKEWTARVHLINGDVIEKSVQV